MHFKNAPPHQMIMILVNPLHVTAIRECTYHIPVIVDQWSHPLQKPYTHLHPLLLLDFPRVLPTKYLLSNCRYDDNSSPCFSYR